MKPKLTLIAGIFLLFQISTNAQTSEGRVYELSAKTKFYLHPTDQAQLQGAERYIHVGLAGNTADIDELVGYMDRYTVTGNDMTTQVSPTVTDAMVSYYKFYLNPLYDANNFQKMLEMLQIEKYYLGDAEKPINTFSNTILAFIKSKNQ